SKRISKFDEQQGGGTHGNIAAEPSGYTPRYRRRVSASVRRASQVRRGVATYPQGTLPQFGRSPGRNQAEKVEAPLQGRDGADCFTYPTRARATCLIRSARPSPRGRNALYLRAESSLRVVPPFLMPGAPVG